MCEPLLSSYPHLRYLAAHWTLSSGTSSSVELDLSGNEHHLKLVRAADPLSEPTSCWLRTAPHRLRRPETDFVVETLQNASETDAVCRFRIAIRHREQQHDRQSTHCPRILFVCNFRCFKSTSVTNNREGKWIVALLKECVRALPEIAIVGVLPASLSTTTSAGIRQDTPSHAPFAALMTPSGKVRCTVVDARLLHSPTLCAVVQQQTQASKVLDHLAVPAALDVEELVRVMESGVRWFAKTTEQLDAQRLESSETDVSEPSFLRHTHVVVINESLPDLASATVFTQALAGFEATMDSREAERTNVHILHLRSHAVPTAMTKAPSATSFLCTEYVDCERDFEWVFARVLHRINHVVCTGARLELRVVGNGAIALDDLRNGVEGTTACSDSSNVASSDGMTTVIRYGMYERSETLVLSGVFTATAGRSTSAPPFAAADFVYRTNARQLQVAHVSIRLRHDLTNETHVARVERNDTLLSLHEGASALLLEQRRELMNEKAAFHLRLATQEIAELENTFKRVNIMKEELWARRKWIVERGLRLFEEDELARLDTEASEAAAAYRRRIEHLQDAYTVNTRENSRGNGGDIRAGGAASTQRVQIEQYMRELKRSGGGDDIESTAEEIQHKLEKETLHIDLTTTQLRSLESRMEDMQHSVRVSQTKGTVVMNDTRKAWVVLYADLTASKHQVLALSLSRANTEASLALVEHKQETTSSMASEVKRINSALLRFEKEQLKRKKRTFFCMKEMVGAMQLEADAAFKLESATRAARQCQLLQSPALDDITLFSSCIYVCFPLNRSHADAWTPRNGQQLSNAVHSVLFGLRHFCHEASLAPFSQRIGSQESFLWLEHEQLIASEAPEDESKASNDEKRAQVLQASWNVIVFSYNALFSAPAAVAELKQVLSMIDTAGKQVLHVELEPPFASLDEFKAGATDARESASRQGEREMQRRVLPVEKLYLTWKQNFAHFQAAMAKVSGGAASLRFAPSTLECARCSHAGGVAGAFLPCVPCCWPAISRSTHAVSDGSESDQRSFLHIVRSIGTWIDSLAQSAAQLAIRSHNIDPRSSSALLKRLADYWSADVRACSAAWDDSFSRRRTEVGRQLQKLFTSMEEEAQELVQLRYMLTKRKQAMVASCLERLEGFQEQQKWVESLAQVGRSAERSEAAVQATERERMIEEEMVQTLNEADRLSSAIDKLEELDSSENPSSSGIETKLALLKGQFEVSLKRSIVRILELGKRRVENQLGAITKHFSDQQELDELERLASRCDFEKVRVQCRTMANDDE